MGTVAQLASAVEDAELVFRLSDAEHEHTDVKVWFDVELAPERQSELGMVQVEGGWELRLGLPDLDCLEYLFDVDGTLVPDPGNPDRVEGAFGPHSWLAMPGYRPPAWLDVDAAPGERHQLTLGEIDVEVWEPAGHDGASLPLLLVHDGAEMDAYGGVVRYAATRPPMRVGLLAPGRRPGRAVRREPGVRRCARRGGDPGADRRLSRRRTSRCCWARASGGWRPCTPPGSTPTPSRGWCSSPGRSSPRSWTRRSRTTPTSTTSSASWPRSTSPTAAPQGFPPVAFTCGLAEENLANNRLMHNHLDALGVPATWGEVRQGHTWMCWRDTLDPHLGDLLGEAWH